MLVLVYAIVHTVCFAISVGIIIKTTQTIKCSIDRSGIRMLKTAGALIGGPLALVFILVVYATMEVIDNMDPEVKKLKKKYEELKNQNVNLVLQMDELDRFVKELRN